MAIELLNKIGSRRTEHAWISSTKFEPENQQSVLELVLRKTQEEYRSRIKHGGKKVAVVLDLDSTIFDVKPRTLRILKEFASTSSARELSPKICDWCMSLDSGKLLYTLDDTARANEFPEHEKNATEFMKEAFRFWRARFFSDSYLTTDRPTPGAVQFAHRVADAGAYIVYLTGRDWPGMGRGTNTMLENCGFPKGRDVGHLIMKPNAGIDDADFKDEALRKLRTELNVTALFDNEPSNFYVFERNFPEAMLVFYHSNCSPKPADPVTRIYRIENFLMR